MLGWARSLGLLNLICILDPWRLIWHWAETNIWICNSWPGAGPEQEPWFVGCHPVPRFVEARIEVVTMSIQKTKQNKTIIENLIFF